MRIIEQYSNFIAEYKPITLYIKGGKIITLNQEKSKEKELLIRSIISEIYPNINNRIITIADKIIRGELINKAQKNIAILYEIIDIAKSENIIIDNADDLIHFIRNNKMDLFSYNGRYFDRIYNRLSNVSKKGLDKENKSNEIFIEYAKSKNITIDIIPVEDHRDDINGIDSYFIMYGKKYTIQTKTLSNIIDMGDVYHIYISGYYTKVKTHYLVLVDNNKNSGYIFKGSNIITNDVNNISYYIINKSSLLYYKA